MSIAIEAAIAGRYFRAANPTPGTPLAFAVVAAPSESAGYFLAIRATSVNHQVVLDFIRLLCSVVPASAESGQFAIKIDKASRYVSGGTRLTPVQCNMAETGESTVRVYAGDLTTSPPIGNARIVADGMLRAAIPVAGDEWILKFGSDCLGEGALLESTVAERIIIPCPPVVLCGEQHTALLQLWFPSNSVTPAQFEIEVGWREVPK